MAKFLGTSAASYYLEELIKTSKERVILISPFLKLNDRIKELLEDKNRLKIDVRIIYGKSELQNDEISWLSKLDYIRTSFCKNLHAKCYLNEETCIITSLNLYEFSQVNNNEMGVYISKMEDEALYKDAYDEAQRIIRISEEVRITLEKISDESEKNIKTNSTSKENYTKLTIHKLSKKLKKNVKEVEKYLISKGYLEIIDNKEEVTAKGKQVGGEIRTGKYGDYSLWDKDLTF